MKNAKKLTAILLALVMTLSLLAGCGAKPSPAPATAEPTPNNTTASTPEAAPTELIVFAAASLTETLKELGGKYMAENKDVKLVFNFESSGTLKTQIQEGADCDVFISAGQKQMNQLDITAKPEINTDGLDFVLEGTRFNILENKVALAVPEGNPANINSYDDMVAGLKDGSIMLAMGNSDVPVGQYTQKILSFYQLDESALADSGVLTYGSNVKEVTTQVSEATVDCGIIYQTDAFSAGLTVVDTATAEMCGQVIYPAAVLNVSKNIDAAKAFLEYLKGDEAAAVFETVGFTPIAQSAGEEAAYPVTVTDAAGRTLTIESEPESILTVYALKYVLALGLGDKVVNKARGNFELAVAPNMANGVQFGSDQMNAETIAEISPDIFIHKASATEMMTALDELGIQSMGIYMETPEEVAATIELLGTALGVPERAKELVEYYKKLMGTGTELTKGIADADRPTAILLGNTIGKVANKTMLQSIMIESAGGVNLAADIPSEGTWPVVGTEQIFEWNPDFIFIMNSTSRSFDADTIMNDPAWAELTAVKNGNVFVVPSDMNSWEYPCVESALGTIWMISKMFPELVTDGDLVKYVNDFYSFVYNVSFTREQLNY